MRVELRDGQWADLREHITHATDKQIKVARLQAMKDDTVAFDWGTVLVRAFVRDWNVKDPDGNPITIADPDAIERAPDDIIDELFDPCSEAWAGATVPNQAYARLVGRLVLGQRVSDAEIAALPDPETFNDALILAFEGRWSPTELDGVDALLLALIHQLKTPRSSDGP
jgi:hypothetical protein